MDTPQRICKLHQPWVKTDHENSRHLLNHSPFLKDRFLLKLVIPFSPNNEYDL